MRRTAPLLILALVACAPAPGTVSPPTTLPPVSTSAPETTTSTVPAHETTEALVGPFSEMGPGWSELFFPYGETEEYLGISPGGEGLLIGPEYGTQTGDGRWWFLDTANRRIARYSEEGLYLSELPIPEAVLVNGGFTYQLPQALDVGSITASRLRNGGMDILTATEDRLIETRLGVEVPWVTTDGLFLFGTSADGAIFRLANWEASVTQVGWISSRDRGRYRVTVDRDELHIELPDAGVTRTIQMRLEEQPEVVVHFGVQVETGVDGTLFILVFGAPLTDPNLGVGGLLTVASDGTVGRMQPIVDLFSSADPGSPAHLGVRPGTSTPWVMVIGETGVHIHVRHN